MYLKSPGEIVNDSRTYLGHTEAAAVDFAVILCAEVRFFYQDMTRFLSTGRDYSRIYLPLSGPHDVDENPGAYNGRLPHLCVETAAVDFAVILYAEVRFLLGHGSFPRHRKCH